MSGISGSQGVVYTPEYWADWAVREYEIHKKWMNGSRILDPGCGKGALIEAVIRNALSEGFKPSTEDLTRLSAVDIDAEALRFMTENIEQKYELCLPEESIKQSDFLLDDNLYHSDIILANPPWLTFGDLDQKRKDLYKPIFRASGLTPKPQDLLLGGSRIDIAALFVITALEKHLTDGGEAYFFLPMSLYRSEGAHKAFRRLPLSGGRSCALSEIRELDGGPPFPGAGTRHGFACYQQGRRQTWPIRWLKADNKGGWQPFEARPVSDIGSPLIPFAPGEVSPAVPKIHVPDGCRPRQGANPCGAAEAFIIEDIGQEPGPAVSVVNRKGREGYLPRAFLHPLMASENFTRGKDDAEQRFNDIPGRWIFMPYNSDGTILGPKELAGYPEAQEWLNIHRNKLENRRGSLISRWKEKDIWWAMMGVAPYAFAPWKLAWEAYGRKEFHPRIFEKKQGAIWQGNQALHAYLPFYERGEAERVLSEFKKPEVELYLRTLGGAGTKLWAQPGRIARLIV